MQLEMQTVLIELDSLIDTRLGLLKQHWQDKCDTLDFDSYLNRVRSDFWTDVGISTEEWVEKWKNRDVDTLLHSHHSEMYYNLPLILGGLLTNGLLSPVHEEVRLYINYWPYKLTKDEIEDLIFSVKQRITGNCEIEAVYYPPDKLTPELMADNYKAYVTYDLEAWLAEQNDALVKRRIPTVTVYYPALINHYSEDEWDVLVDKQINPFEEMRKRLSEYLTLDGVDASLFSCHYFRHQSL